MLDHTKLSEVDKVKLLEPLKAGVDKCKSSISNARPLMLDGELEAKEYKEIRDDYEYNVRKLEAQIVEMTLLDSELKEQLEFCRELLPNLTKYYDTADLRAKQKMVGSIFPGKLIFEEKKYRTIRVNEVVLWMCRPVAGSNNSTNEKCPENSEHSHTVLRTGIEPAHCCQYQILRLFSEI